MTNQTLEKLCIVLDGGGGMICLDTCTAPFGNRVCFYLNHICHPSLCLNLILCKMTLALSNIQDYNGINILSGINSLKASFNNVFTLTNLSYMSLHAISIFDKVQKWKLHLKSTIKCFKRVKICKWPEIPYSFLPLEDCCVRINGPPDRLFSHRYLDRDRINFKTFVFLAV